MPVTGRPTNTFRGRRTSSRSTADEPSTSTASTPAEVTAPPEEDVPMETDHGDLGGDGGEEEGSVDDRLSYICSILLAENRTTREKLGPRPVTTEPVVEVRNEQPVSEQVQQVEQVIITDSLETILKHPQFAIVADLTKSIDSPEAVASSSRTMHPIEVKIEETEASGAVASSSVLPSASGGETNVERAAKREAHVLSRIAELRRNGLWSNSRLPKCVEPERNKTHWDYLLEEVKWMATDFRTETTTKRRVAKALAGAIAKQHRDKEIEVERAAEREIRDKKKMCAGIAKMIKDFWQGVDKVVDIRAKEILESRLRKARNKHLMFMIGQVDEMSNIVQERLVPSKTPSIASHDDDKEFEAGDDSESDDERTIANAEKSMKNHDVKQEVNALQDEANADMDDFLSTLPPEYLEAYGLTLEDLEEMKRQNKLEREEAARKKKEDTSAMTEEMEVDEPPALEEKKEEEEQSQDKGAEDGNGDGRGVLVNVDYTKLNSNDSDERQQELANIAEEALKFQPKGYTLETTQVKTPVPFLIRGTLREYQMVGLDWMVTLYEKNLNGILADEMGLGKTIQTISLLAHLACSESIWGPHLIVVPTSVILNWEMEFKKWCPSLKILTYFGTAKERAEKRKGWMKPNCFHVCITSYKTVTQDIRSFKQRAWQYLILDEAQNIKNWKSQRWQALLNVRARRRLLLTGTPLQNSLMELWSLMHFLMPTIFSSHDDFKDWFSNPLTGMMEGSMEFNAPLIQRLHKVLRPFILRRLKKEVEKQLPEKTEHIINCSLSKRQRYLYDDFMSRRSTKENLKSGNMMSVLNIVMQLRKCCNHPNLFEPRPVVAPFIVHKIQMDVPASLFQIADQEPEEPSEIPSIFNLRLGWQTQVSSKKPLIQEMEVMETVLDLKPPVVEGFRFNRTTFVTKNVRESLVEGMGSEEEVKMNGTNGTTPSNNASVPSSRTNNLIRSRTVMNTAPLTITTDRSGFHYTMSNNRHSQLDENAPQSPPLKRVKLTGVPVQWANYVPKDVLERLEESKRNQMEIVRRRFGQFRQPVLANELIALLVEEINGETPQLRKEKDEHIQEHLLDYIGLLGERFGLYVEPVLTDAWECRPSSSGLPSYIRHNMDKVEKDSRTLLLRTSSQLDTRISIGRSLQFPELRLIEYDCGKLQTLALLLRQLYLYKHRCLIFTQMSKMLDVLQTFLSHHGYQYFRLDGSTGIEQRQAMMERFNADPKIFCFILSTRSGGVGVNLTGADTVIFYDSDWNPTMDAQAQDRCHRIGQTRNVSIYRLISERTIEENILKKAMQKRRLGELAIDEAGFTPEFFKQSDNIRDLFDGENVDVEIPKDVPVNEKELESAMAKCEDEADVNAAKVAAAEARVDVAEFDENSKVPTSNLAGDEEADEKYMELIQQLKPIERFAINLLEAEYKPEFEEECKEAEAMIEQKREEWDKNLNDTAAADGDPSIMEDDIFNNDFYQSGSLLDEVRDRRKNKLKTASGVASAKPKKAPSVVRVRSPSKRKSHAPSFNPYISYATHVSSSPPDSPVKKPLSFSKRSLSVGGGASILKTKPPVRKSTTRRTVTRDEDDDDNDYSDLEEQDQDYKPPAATITVMKKVSIVEPKKKTVTPKTNTTTTRKTIVKTASTPSSVVTPLHSPIMSRAQLTATLPNSRTNLPSQGPLVLSAAVRPHITSPIPSTSSASSSSSVSAPALPRPRGVPYTRPPPASSTRVLPRAIAQPGAAPRTIQYVRRSVPGQGPTLQRIPVQRPTGNVAQNGRGSAVAPIVVTPRVTTPQSHSPKRLYPVRMAIVPRQPVAPRTSSERPNFGDYSRVYTNNVRRSNLNYRLAGSTGGPSSSSQAPPPSNPPPQ